MASFSDDSFPAPLPADVSCSDSCHRQLVEWNATRSPFPHESCITELFEAQVARTPEAPALIFRDQSTSYRLLDDHANQLAHYLRGHGVGPEVLVGLCVERSMDAIVGLLGILKAGAVAVGAGSAMVDKQAVADKNWAKLTETARSFVDAVAQARAGK